MEKIAFLKVSESLSGIKRQEAHFFGEYKRDLGLMGGLRDQK